LGNNYPKHTAQLLRRPTAQYKNRFAANKIFQRRAFSIGECGRHPAWPQPFASHYSVISRHLSARNKNLLRLLCKKPNTSSVKIVLLHAVTDYMAKLWLCPFLGLDVCDWLTSPFWNDSTGSGRKTWRFL